MRWLISTILLICSLFAPNSHYSLAEGPSLLVPIEHKAILTQENVRVGRVKGQIRDLRLPAVLKISRQSFLRRAAAELKLDLHSKLVSYKTITDPYGYTHTRHNQTYKDLEIMGAEMITQEKEGAVVHAVVNVIPGLDLDTTPTLSESEALKAALDHIGAEQYMWEAEPEKYSKPKGELVISSKNQTFAPGSFHVVYRFTIKTMKPYRNWDVHVDAHNGEVVNQLNNILEADIPSQGNCTYRGKVSFTADDKWAGDNYRLYRNTPPKIFMRDVRKPNLQGNLNTLSKDVFFTDVDNNFQDPEDEVGVCVHWALQQATAYFKKNFGRLGWDAVGKLPINVEVHNNSERYEAAYIYDKSVPGNYKMIFKGDGIENESSPSVSLDIVAHEFAHGVIAHAVNGIPVMGEAGAIHEALADIFAVLVDFAVDPTKANWTIGEKVTLDKHWMRDIANPQGHPEDAKLPKLPDTYQGKYYVPVQQPCVEANDYCGVHDNSTVVSYWFYLLVNGGQGVNDLKWSYKVKGIGLEKAAMIMYFTLITKLFPHAQFADMRLGTISIAEFFFGKDSPEYQAIINSWHAVGIGDAYKETPRYHSPRTGMKDMDPWPTRLAWEAKPNEYMWEIQVSPSASFEKGVKTQQVSFVDENKLGGMTTTHVDFNLNSNTTYYWRVRAKSLSESASMPSPQANVPIDKGISADNTQSIRPKVGHEAVVVPITITAESAKSSVRVKPEEWSEWFPTFYFKTASKKSKNLSPGSGVTQHPWNAELSWAHESGVLKYIVQLADDSTFPMKGTTSRFTSATREKFKLKKGAQYYWRVGLIGPDEAAGEWSDVTSFNTAEPQTSLLAPKDAATVPPWAISLEWLPVEGAEAYKYYVSTEPNMDKAFLSGEVQENSHAVSVPDSQQPYYWAVQPIGPGPYHELGLISATRSFKVDYKLTAPVLKSPLNPPYPWAIGYKATPVTFQWQTVPGAVNYNLSIYKKNAPNQAVYEQDVVQGKGQRVIWHVPSAVVSGDKAGYCWKVRATKPYPGEVATGCYEIAPSSVILKSPVNNVGTSFHANLGVFYWESPNDNEYPPDKYVFQLYEGSLNKPAFGTSLKDKKYILTSKLKPDQTYLWEVHAVAGPNNIQASSGGTLGIFHTGSEAKQVDKQAEEKGGQGLQACSDLKETVVTNLSPQSSAQYCPTCVTKTPVPSYAFQWQPISGAKAYRIEISIFGLPKIIYSATVQGTQSAPIPLKYYTGYIVNVLAVNTCDQVGTYQGKGLGFFLVP